MLKALELIGFKSFAEKTHFEFSPGVTCVVGPNGSGKSNVVDALKWVLGEQSPKSLRGKEMADVIFNGSGARKPVNAAEVTLTFDNSSSLLPLETAEVHITRRVYRSGEGEYLINRQPSRLRDIKELFAGTGASGEAYAVIEQGKVDALLQSSARDRRQIFEEAAGISRFKANKQESQRRLERVDQNLLRLADIVEEVENQLRTVRAQASKARRYQEYSQRLQSLRTQAGLVDYRKLTAELTSLNEQISDGKQQIAVTGQQAQQLEQEAGEVDAQLAELNDQGQSCQRELSATVQQLASSEATIQANRSKLRDLQDEVVRARSQVAVLLAQSRHLLTQQAAVQQTLQSSRVDHQQAVDRLQSDERELAGFQQGIDQARLRRDSCQLELRGHLRRVAQLGGEISSLSSQLESARAVTQRTQSRLEELEAMRGELADSFQQLRQQEQQLEQSLQQETERLAQAQHKLSERRERRAAWATELSQLEGSKTAASQRVGLLEDLERRHEGVSPGVKQVLQAAREDPDGPFGQVRGLVADLLQVSVDSAPLVELALGEAAQQVVVAQSTRLLAYLREDPDDLAGRVTFLRLDAFSELLVEFGPDLESREGVIGRVDRFVETSEEFGPLARRLLGRTWVVQTLPQGLELAEQLAAKGDRVSFVTLAGELLAADGSVSLGPRNAALGLISRRSELRELRDEVARIAEEIAGRKAELEELDGKLREDQQQVEAQTEKRQQVQDELVACRQQIGAVEGRLGQLAEQRGNLEAELTSAQEQVQVNEAALQETENQLVAAEAEVTSAEQAVSDAQSDIDELETSRATHAAAVTTAKVELAKSEQRLIALQDQLDQLDREYQRRRSTAEETAGELAAASQRAENTALEVLNEQSRVAFGYLRKETLAGELNQFNLQSDRLAARRAECFQAAGSIRQQVREKEDQIHGLELESNELRLKRTTLVDRLRDDYAVDVSQLDHQADEEEMHQREQADEEIESLRRRISQLGNVNMEALAELDDLESRFSQLSAQYQDLVQAKASLEKIINKINADSRRLFLETVEAVRVHFRELFRKLFGGGQANIELEDQQDVLECGVEILARPPGKEPRSISLLSGGEKTLTCVALLLAIFRNRPSPFCVLDEVDAALDEANNERFVNVLQEFTGDTQFIVVTHSKKTMTFADTLYGVTMQESGISKRVSVRFEEVQEGGQISPEAAARTDLPAPAGTSAPQRTKSEQAAPQETAETETAETETAETETAAEDTNSERPPSHRPDGQDRSTDKDGQEAA